jgi:hypothetical protein
VAFERETPAARQSAFEPEATVPDNFPNSEAIDRIW